jgi:hypothetical protein
MGEHGLKKSRHTKYVIVLVIGYLLAYVPGWIGGLGILIGGGSLAAWILSGIAIAFENSKKP